MYRLLSGTVVLAVVLGLVFLIPPTTSTKPDDVVWHATEQKGSTVDGMFVVGEELTYNVSYAFLDIGQIRIKLLERVGPDTNNSFHAIAFIDSYSGIPFVDLHTIYESKFGREIYSRWFRSRVKDGRRWYATVYTYDYPAGKMYFEKYWWGKDSIEVRDSLTLDTLYQDGLSLYYYARKNLRLNSTVVVPTMISEEKVRTIIDFKNKRTSVTIDAVDYPVDVVEFDGVAEFEGIYGLTGEFQGWFSNDDAHVPILAKMQVIIGNVRIELMKWNRPGWKPPRYDAK